MFKLLPIERTLSKIKTSYPKRIRERLRRWNMVTMRQAGMVLR